ncbi:AMP-binding protein [Marinicella sp. W31]|uniref:AMP-binding protein n=1 Tax=Marinicella sp. W31 TaxID=3023713 RepID=UPI003756A6F3
MPSFLQSLLLKAYDNYLDHTALSLGKDSYTYAQLLGPAMQLACALQNKKGSAIGVLADKNLSGYQAICAVMLSGKTYVPLNTAFPAQRNAEIIRQSGADTVIVAADNHDFDLDSITTVLDGAVDWLIMPQRSIHVGQPTRPEVVHDTDASAYVLLTSGSTGVPKAVPITDTNIASYVQQMQAAFDFSADDRFSQFFDFTFDLSLHDMLLCWDSGACLCPGGRSARLMPLHFARKQNITVWFSVPSLALTAKDMLGEKFTQLALSDVRLSFFCGEALPAQLAQDWQIITAQAPVINLYGPTEATIAFTAQTWHAELDSPNGIVPIGYPLGENRCAIVDTQGQTASRGELCLAGPQVFSGYLHRPELEPTTFFKEATGLEWYRTGDLCEYTADGSIVYLGRLDRQVQVKGYRVELQEVEHQLRKITGSATVAVVPYPSNAVGEPTGLTAFVSPCGLSEADLIQQCQRHMPAYMVPQYCLFLKVFPHNNSGKLDYKSLLHDVETYLHDNSQLTA